MNWYTLYKKTLAATNGQGFFILGWWGVLLFSSSFFCWFVEVCIECREGAKKHNRNNVFNPFNMCVEIRQGVKFLHQTNGYQVLPQQFRNLPVYLC